MNRILGWMMSKNSLHPSANLLLDRIVCFLNIYHSAGGIGGNFLFAAHQACLQGAALPVGFGASLTVFIPKSSQTDAHGHTIRSLEALRPLTLYATVTSKCLPLPCAMGYKDTLSSAFTLHRDASLSVSSRITFLKSRRRVSHAYPRVNHRWIFLVGEGWRLARGYLFTLAFDHFYRWFMSPVLPPEPHWPWFLHVPVPTPKTLLSLRLLCVSPSRQSQMPPRPLNTVIGMSQKQQEVSLDPIQQLGYLAAFRMD